MDALLFALSFEVVLLQMRILAGSSELRLQGWQPTNKVEKLQQTKLVQDRDKVVDVIRKTLIEVVDSGEWPTIKKTIEELKQKDCDVTALKLTNEQLRSSKAAILLDLGVKRDLWAAELRDADRKVAVLRDKMSDDLLNANTRLCYAEKWLYARFESLELQHDKPRAPRPRTDHEDRVHSELLHAYELQIKEREDSLEYWRKRYDKDTADISVRVREKSEELRVARAKREELQNLYNLHEGEMRGWLTFKRERAARLAREEHLRQSAIRIQAWWRGVMVRKALGQFKYLRHSKKQPAKGKKK
ncbi:dynein regulatory complex protein 9-like [Anticarsia gemmatalis]|uniref:dynein regulatory complex protein 9-like n=1 Tax=Anticarsia gemmatalis TaxID=129554 RepID=UPI003F764812